MKFTFSKFQTSILVAMLFLFVDCLPASSPAKAEEPQRNTAEGIRQDRLKIAQQTYRRLLKKAATLPEAIRLKKHRDNREYLMKAAERNAREPLTRGGFGFGIRAHARSMGEAAGRATAARQAKDNRRAMKRHQAKLDAYVKAQAWSLASSAEQDLLAEFYPSLVHEVGASDKFPALSATSRPSSWQRYHAPAAPIEFMSPVQPAIEGEGPVASYRSVIKKGNTELLLTILDLGEEASADENNDLNRTTVESLAKSSRGEIQKSSVCKLAGRNGHEATITFVDAGAPRHLTAKSITLGNKVIVVSVLQDRDQADSPIAKWFFDSIRLY